MFPSADQYLTHLSLVFSIIPQSIKWRGKKRRKEKGKQGEKKNKVTSYLSKLNLEYFANC